MPDPGSGRANAGDAPVLEYVTRFLPTTNNKAKVILPYVEDAIRTVGYGSAVAMGDQGIQITVPEQLMHFLEATINGYDTMGSAITEFEERQFYPPAIRVKATNAVLKELVDALGLCPPDMRIEWLSLGDSGVLLVSGPLARKDHFTKNVLPSLMTLANQLNPSFGLPPH